MAKRLVVSAIALVTLLVAVSLAYSQARQPGGIYDFDRKGETPGPAPRRDIGGIWIPAAGAQVGVQADGAQLKPARGRPQDELPFTPLGRKTWMARKPSVGVTAVNPALTDDPVKGGVTGCRLRSRRVPSPGALESADHPPHTESRERRRPLHAQQQVARDP